MEYLLLAVCFAAGAAVGMAIGRRTTDKKPDSPPPERAEMLVVEDRATQNFAHYDGTKNSQRPLD